MSRTYSSISRNHHNVSSQRITRQNLLTLRAAEMKEDKVRKIFASVCNELHAAIGSLFAVKPAKSNSMCKYYGHVIRGAWSGYLPKCDDCGCEVSNPSELRKSAAKV
jgi:hypothetical protein